jgi:hypothetical protein
VSEPDEVFFREFPVRWLLRLSPIVLLFMLLIRGLFLVAAVAAGASLTFGDFVEAVLISLAATVAAGLGVWTVRRRNPGWVRMSAAGLEFAAARHRATFLPWAGIASVRRRYPRPFTQLLVTPTGLGVSSYAQTTGLPPRRHDGAFVIDVSMMTPGPEAVLAELDRRRHTLA